jgi:sugar diacid utilization regulator
MKRYRIKEILKEEVEYEVQEDLFPYTKTKTKSQTDIAVELMHKAMNHLAAALRNIESAMQFAQETNDDKLISSLEDIRKSLLHSQGNGAGWEGEEEHDNIINQLGDLIDDYSENYDNFNLSGSHDSTAPSGNFE